LLKFLVKGAGMKIVKNSVVTLMFELKNTDGGLIEKTDEPIAYLHGGYDGIFLLVEQELEGKDEGHQCEIRLLPQDAFGEYDARLIRMEPRDQFPAEVATGMQFEGRGSESGQHLIYTVTDVTADQVVVDGNHPLAGQTLIFSCNVMEVRPATKEELSHGHVHGAHGHHH
jgi:FKBP-type peptidyl-prolyl cis-trans isomerase SlyD